MFQLSSYGLMGIVKNANKKRRVEARSRHTTVASKRLNKESEKQSGNSQVFLKYFFATIAFEIFHSSEILDYLQLHQRQGKRIGKLESYLH